MGRPSLRLGATATGTVLAAFGTALPESAVTFMAVVFGRTPEQKDIGVGAAMGGPLVLSTVAYAVVGLTPWSLHRAGSAHRGRHQRRPAPWRATSTWSSHEVFFFFFFFFFFFLASS